MKIIDEKGRLFGKVNIIDFLVLLFIFFLVPMFYFGYKLFSKKNIATPGVAEEYMDTLVLGLYSQLGCRIQVIRVSSL